MNFGEFAGAVPAGGAAAALAIPAMAAVLEDRSDTWSVDAIASDSEADPTNRNEDLLMIDDGGSESGKLSFFAFTAAPLHVRSTGRITSVHFVTIVHHL